MRFGIREMIFVVVLLGIPAGVYFFVFKPRNQQTHAAQEYIHKNQARLRELDTFTSDANSLDAQIVKLKDAVALFEHKVPSQSEVEVILREVSDLTARHHLLCKNINTEKAVPAAQYVELPIALVVTGDFDGFYGFLLDLEKLPRITRMPRLSIKRGAAKAGQIEASMTLSIFYDAQAGGADSGKGRS